jgi:hypothetical protein
MQDMISLVLQLCKVWLRLDQPTAALEAYGGAAERHPGDTGLLLGSARVHEALDQSEKALELYHQVGGWVWGGKGELAIQGGGGGGGRGLSLQMTGVGVGGEGWGRGRACSWQG